MAAPPCPDDVAPARPPLLVVPPVRDPHAVEPGGGVVVLPAPELAGMRVDGVPEQPRRRRHAHQELEVPAHHGVDVGRRPEAAVHHQAHPAGEGGLHVPYERPHRGDVRYVARHLAVVQRHAAVLPHQHRQVDLRQRHAVLVAAPPDLGEGLGVRRYRRRVVEEPVAPPVTPGEGRAERVALRLADRGQQLRGALGGDRGAVGRGVGGRVPGEARQRGGALADHVVGQRQHLVRAVGQRAPERRRDPRLAGSGVEQRARAVELAPGTGRRGPGRPVGHDLAGPRVHVPDQLAPAVARLLPLGVPPRLGLVHVHGARAPVGLPYQGHPRLPPSRNHVIYYDT